MFKPTTVRTVSYRPRLGPLLLQRGTWSVTAVAVHTLKSLHSQCAFVKSLLGAHVSARCFYSRYVVSHYIRGAHVQVTAHAVRM